jgi:hypothetical protein
VNSQSNNVAQPIVAMAPASGQAFGSDGKYMSVVSGPTAVSAASSAVRAKEARMPEQGPATTVRLTSIQGRLP